MKRLLAATISSVALLSACGGGEPATDTTANAPAAETLPETAPDPTALPPPEPLQADRIGAMNLSCGGEQFRVAFVDSNATLVNDDGSNTDLPLLPAGPESEPGVQVFTDGRISFAKKGGGDTPTEIRFARGRMAWIDCAIAQN
jgi:hypothetical protein